MTMNTTRWSPDTCNCIIDYEWDDSLPNDLITMTPVNIVNVCSDHQKLPPNITLVDFYNVLMEENPRKNASFQHILDNGPSSLYDIVNNTRVLKKDVSFVFNWSGTAPNRTLNITVQGVSLTTNQKNVAQTALNNRFGVGKVVVLS